MSETVISLLARLDPDAIQRRASDPTCSVWVAASAGTGKTKVLTDRALSLMLADTPPQRILCLTFTKAAAAEMNTRIAERLGGWAADGDEEVNRDLRRLLGRHPTGDEFTCARRLFARVLDTPGGMNIQTLHAFCQSLLSRFPLEAGVPPHFAVLGERDAEELLIGARETVLRGAQRDQGSLARALSMITAHLREDSFADLMASLTADRQRIRRCIGSHGSVDGAITALRKRLGLADGDTPETVVARACDDRSFDGPALDQAAAAVRQGSKAERRRGTAIGEWLRSSAQDRIAGFQTYCRQFLTTANPPALKELANKETRARMPDAKRILQDEGERLITVEMQRRAAVTAQATAAMLTLGEAVLQAYQRLKDARSLMDYDDLIVRASQLLQRDGGASWVLFKLDGGIDHVLIDEAQDTSPDQWQVVRALTTEFFAGSGSDDRRRTVFAVGDAKQSIFSFQGADPTQFISNRDWYAQRVEAAGKQWRPVGLTLSFRSTRAILAAVDAVFAAAEAADGVALDGEAIEHEAFRGEDGGSVEVWPPIDPQATDAPPPWTPPIERTPADSPEARLARLIARRIKDILDKGEVVPAENRAVAPSDIMVLVRRRTAFVEQLVRALKDLNVPVAGVDRMLLTEQIAVMDLLALGHFVLLPTDDLTLATVLRSPLVGLEEEQLFELAWQRPGSLWQSLRGRTGTNPVFSHAAAFLSDMLALADTVPVFEFFALVLGPFGGRKKLLARLGREAEDPLTELLQLALDYERSHPSSLQGFLHWIETGTVEIKRDLDQSQRSAVTIMTVHGAKGLQAPIVFLPDTMQAPSNKFSVLWPDPDRSGAELPLWPPSRAYYDPVAERERERLAARQRQEYRRLLYVAMTRAEDRLIVCGWRTKRREPDDCWYHLIRRGLESGAVKIGVEQVEDAFLAKAPEIDSARILRLTGAQTRQLPKSSGSQRQAEWEPLPDWARQPAPDEERPPRPLAPSRPDENDPAVRSPFGHDDGARFKRGRLVHRLLQSLPDLPPEHRRDVGRRWLARRVHGIDADQQGELLDEVMGVLDHPDHGSLFGPGSQAEAPLSGEVNGQIISAQVDRLLILPDLVTILDYKTDRPPPTDSSAVPVVYLRQMAAYRALLGRIYADRPVHCVLLWTNGPRLMKLDDALLDRYAP